MASETPPYITTANRTSLSIPANAVSPSVVMDQPSAFAVDVKRFLDITPYLSRSKAWCRTKLVNKEGRPRRGLLKKKIIRKWTQIRGTFDQLLLIRAPLRPSAVNFL